MPDKAKYVLEERPESDVYLTDNGFIGIRQKIRGAETAVLFTPEETVKIIEFLKECLAKAEKK